jgi:Holliday junction DNA helicase RuvA
MIGKLSGKVAEIAPEHIMIDVNGVGYIVFCSSKLVAMYHVDDQISLITQTIMRENNISIFGFETTIDKYFFNHLLSIQGVGAKLSQTIIGNIGIDEIIKSVQTSDKARFTEINGVGSKLADRLISELKNKKFISKLENIKLKEDIANVDDEISRKILDATSALSNLGYGEAQINSSIHDVISMNKDVTLEELIKLGIKKISVLYKK